MKALALATLVLNFLVVDVSFAGYPTGPVQSLTPGQLCANPNSHRYPEKIAYCNRDVSPALKRQIIENYDQSLGYSIQNMPRKEFKIDHFIPLCMGGSNDISNLWPQHESVFSQTDALEAAICEQMSYGKISQKDAVKLIMTAKRNLKQARNILLHVRGL